MKYEFEQTSKFLQKLNWLDKLNQVLVFAGTSGGGGINAGVGGSGCVFFFYQNQLIFSYLFQNSKASAISICDFSRCW